MHHPRFVAQRLADQRCAGCRGKALPCLRDACLPPPRHPPLLWPGNRRASAGAIARTNIRIPHRGGCTQSGPWPLGGADWPPAARSSLACPKRTEPSEIGCQEERHPGVPAKLEQPCRAPAGCTAGIEGEASPRRGPDSTLGARAVEAGQSAMCTQVLGVVQIPADMHQSCCTMTYNTSLDKWSGHLNPGRGRSRAPAAQQSANRKPPLQRDNGQAPHEHASCVPRARR
jgi:hypothetical protein